MRSNGAEALRTPRSQERPAIGGLDRSLRRYYIDLTETRWLADAQGPSVWLDVGGGRTRRGEFAVDAVPGRGVHVDIARERRPDVQADAIALPFLDSVFDFVLCTELMEHVIGPDQILAELHRVLRPGGRLFLCAPFLYQIHGDPDDFARYTGSFWRRHLVAHGFVVDRIEKQGLYWSVLVDLVRSYVVSHLGGDGLLDRLVYRAASWVIKAGKAFAIRRDARPGAADDPMLGSFTTGFAVVATKA
jgi:ubiquinone/menaquinone biosynthesis C-methylase UbiE